MPAALSYPKYRMKKQQNMNILKLLFFAELTCAVMKFDGDFYSSSQFHTPKIELKSFEKIVDKIAGMVESYVLDESRLGIDSSWGQKLFVNETTQNVTSGNGHFDKYPADVQNIGRLFQTMEEHPQPKSLETTGNVPAWLKGSFYRNGPGKYEFGNDTFKHFFDPSAIVQRLEIKDSKIQYRSQFIKSRNYLGNLAADKIVYNEVGTWAESWEVSHYEDGTPITSVGELAMVS
jgi:hypothetical protein